MGSAKKAGIARKAGEGRVLNVLGERVTCKIVTTDSGGSVTVMEEASDPNGGPPPHTHEHEDEVFYILGGTYEFRLGDKTLTATAGDCLFGPRGTLHGFRNCGGTPAKLLVIVSPSGIERCFEELNRLPSGPPNIASVYGICKKYGITILADS